MGVLLGVALGVYGSLNSCGVYVREGVYSSVNYETRWREDSA